MTTEKNTSDTKHDGEQPDEEVYRCNHCGEELGTPGGEPTEDCPTCGNSDWDGLVTNNSTPDSGPTHECPTCGQTEPVVEVWESPEDAKTGCDPDYLGCTECESMVEVE